MNRPVLLDTSFLVALERETAAREEGPVRRFLPALRGRKLLVSVVTVEEVLEAAPTRLWRSPSSDGFQSRACISLRRAESIDADVVGADRVAFERLGPRYLNFL